MRREAANIEAAALEPAYEGSPKRSVFDVRVPESGAPTFATSRQHPRRPGAGIVEALEPRNDGGAQRNDVPAPR